MVVDIHSQSSIGTTVFFKQVLPTKDGVIKQIAFLNGNPQVFGILFTNKVTLMTITEKTLEAVVAKISKVRRFTGMVFD